MARLLDLGAGTDVPEDRRARHLAHAVREPLLESAGLSEERFSALMAAASPWQQTLIMGPTGSRAGCACRSACGQADLVAFEYGAQLREDLNGGQS